jgi:hypothetical protein
MMIGLAPLSNLGSVIASAAKSAARQGVAEARRNLDVNVGLDEKESSRVGAGLGEGLLALVVDSTSLKSAPQHARVPTEASAPRAC